VTRTSDTITAHVRLAGGQHRTLTLPLPEPAWKIRQAKATTIDEIDRLLNHRTCAEIAAILQSRGLANGEGRPYNLTMVQRVIRTYHLRSRRQRLLDAGLIPLDQIAELLGVSPGTVKIWYHAGIVSGQRYNDKGEVLYNPPGPNPPTPHQGRRHDTMRPA
jgi:DNA-binding CsgD family transcriptional regulator